MGSSSNPYAPPKEEGSVPLPRSPSEEVLVSCSVRLTRLEQMSRRMLAGGLVRLAFGWVAAVVAFVLPRLSVAVRLVAAAAAGVVAWQLTALLGGGRRKLPGYSRDERTLTYRFYADGFDVTTAAPSERVELASIRRFVDGPRAFVLYTPQRLAHILPKRDIRGEDIAVLAALFRSKVGSSKQPRLDGQR
jgi:hypothetical protein